MGGDAGVISEVGVGSTFWITVRLKRVADSRQVERPLIVEAPREALARQFAGVRVLVVENEPIYQEVVRFLLADAGLVPGIANNGQEAVELARGGGYALILMDMRMPVMDGLEATRAIRQLPGMSAIPIVAVTANAFDTDRENCLAAGMNDHLAKPVDPGKLCATLLYWLQKATLLESS